MISVWWDVSRGSTDDIARYYPVVGVRRSTRGSLFLLSYAITMARKRGRNSRETGAARKRGRV